MARRYECEGDLGPIVLNTWPAHSRCLGTQCIAFQSQYSSTDAPEVLFRRIENCAKIAILGQNPYMDWQLINNAICLLLTTGLYQRPFEE